MSNYDNIQNALNHIDPQDRETWFRMGAAIKDELGENGFEMWDNWSRQADNYKQTDAQSVWKSIKTGHIHIATLFKVARENGYRPEHPYTPPSPETLAQRAREAQEKQQAEAKRIAQAHAKAEKTAYGIWKNASSADPNHAYAQNKGLDADTLKGIRQNEYKGKKQLIIPMYSEKKLVNVQTIDEDGNKKFLNGGQKQGAYTIIGDFKQNQQGIILAEGYATAASVHQATGKPVVVVFDAGNLKAVSEKLLNVLPENVPVYFAADNDPNQTGLHKAQAAAEVWGERAQILLPEFSPSQIQQYQQEKGVDKVPTDFNDLHKLAGIEAVRERFGLEMVREPEIEAETDFRQPENPNLEPDEPEQEMHNTIEYEAFQREIAPAEPEKNEFRQPKSPSVSQTPPTTELEIEEPEQEKNAPELPAPEQEKSQANTGLDYEVPEHLKSRMVAVDTQRFRLADYEMGAHLLRYTAPDNPKTVLFEDKGKTIHTARDDKQTIQDMLDVAKAKGWDSIKISGSQEFKQQMWLEAESRGIATKGYKPSPEDLAILERRREERATNSIAEAEKLKQQSATPERPEST
ncbi:LPD7 domain-containing protein, partial [Kingella kingae]|uniref:LPD7 domain-containing protein n=1 Tax=Kingella kingae TaxID=504 RepID=UPI0012BBED75